MKLKVNVGDYLRIRIKSDSIYSLGGYSYHNVQCIANRGCKKYLYDSENGRDIFMNYSEIREAIVDDDNNPIGHEFS